MAPKRERRKVFAAMAEAALWEKRGLVLVRGEKKNRGGGGLDWDEKRCGAEWRTYNMR